MKLTLFLLAFVAVTASVVYAAPQGDDDEEIAIQEFLEKVLKQSSQEDEDKVEQLQAVIEALLKAKQVQDANTEQDYGDIEQDYGSIQGDYGDEQNEQAKKQWWWHRPRPWRPPSRPPIRVRIRHIGR